MNKFGMNAEKNLQTIKNIIGDAADFKIREFYYGTERKILLILVFLEGLADKNVIDRDIIKPLTVESHIQIRKGIFNNSSFINTVKQNITTSFVKEIAFIEEAVESILSGDTVLLVDDCDKSLILATQDFEKRTVTEPQTEAVVRGPREGFTENLRTNTSLLRRKIRNPNLKLVDLVLGEQTKTNINIAYIEGIVDKELVEEVKNRIFSIKIDGILESGYIEQFIEDAPLSLFATISNTEKPDVVAAKLLEGRVAILVDGTPFVLCVPYLFMECFQTSEDYYVRYSYATLVRWLRLFAFFITIILPALYVAATTFHQEVIPTDLLITLAAAREGVPFPSMVEVLVMGLIFEVLREAGIRLPRPVGQAVSIVGAVVIGEAAVTSGLIGAPVVMVTAVTAISSFAVPTLGDTTPIIRLFLVLVSGALGLYGIMLGVMVFLIHLCSLRSFGVPYLSPFSPVSLAGFKDSYFIRVPWWLMLKRPTAISRYNQNRQNNYQMPRPPKK